MEQKHESKRVQFSKNMSWLSENFRSYGLLSRLLRVPPKFISRAINSPQDLSYKSIEGAGFELGIMGNVLYGDLDTFKKEVTKWIREKDILISGKQNRRKR